MHRNWSTYQQSSGISQDSAHHLGCPVSTVLHSLTHCSSFHHTRTLKQYGARKYVLASDVNLSILCPLAVNALVVALFHGCHSKTTKVLSLPAPKTICHVIVSTSLSFLTKHARLDHVPYMCSSACSPPISMTEGCKNSNLVEIFSKTHLTGIPILRSNSGG